MITREIAGLRRPAHPNDAEGKPERLPGAPSASVSPQQ